MSPLPDWVARYHGRPFEEKGRGPDAYDCWGLVVDFYRRELGIDLPQLLEGYETTRDLHAIAALAAREKSRWSPIDEAAALAGDVVEFRILGEEAHVGLVVARGMFLHALRGQGVVLERWRSVHWSARFLGVFRHSQVLARA
jgi:cell wall-associated NlpC family hydrolase